MSIELRPMRAGEFAKWNRALGHDEVAVYIGKPL
jgi:hypothetical protein